MIQTLVEVIDEFNPEKDYGIEIRKQYGMCLSVLKKVQYVITDYSRKTKREVPLRMAENKYDVKWYTKLLAECCITVTKPFGLEIIPS